MSKLIFVIPVIQLLILPWAADFEVKNINMEIADKDNSDLSKRLSEKFSASDYFTTTMSRKSYGDSFKKIRAEKSDIILEIPKGFEKNLAKFNEASVLLSVNAINGIKGGLGVSYENNIIADFSLEVFRTKLRIQTQTGLKY